MPELKIPTKEESRRFLLAMAIVMYGLSISCFITPPEPRTGERWGCNSLTSIDANGNEHQQWGTSTTTSGVTRAVDDVWFTEDRANILVTRAAA